MLCKGMSTDKVTLRQCITLLNVSSVAQNRQFCSCSIHQTPSYFHTIHWDVSFLFTEIHEAPTAVAERQGARASRTHIYTNEPFVDR